MENYSICSQKFNEFIQSPIFTAECLSGIRWFFKLYPIGLSAIYNEDAIVIHLCRNCDANVGNIIIDYNYDILKPNGDIFCTTEIYTNREFITTNRYRLLNSIKIKDLYNEMEKWNEDILTIRCHIKCKNPIAWYEAKTTIGCNRCNFIWDISNIKSNNWTANKSFSLVENLNFKIKVTAPEADLLILISELKVQFSKCKITLMVAEIELLSKTSFYSFPNNDDVWEFPSFIPKVFLDERMNAEKICLKFEFSFSSDNESIKIVTDHCSNPEKYCCNTYEFQCLRDDLNALLIGNKHTDVKFQVDGQIFEAHKIILSARSPVFSTMFDQEMAESKTGVIEIVDIDANILNCFLKFIYTGTVDNMEYETALKLLTVAHKYQVPSLEDSCSKFLVTVTSIENVYDILVTSDLIGHKKLKESALDFIKSNASEIMSFPTWPELMETNSKLAFEILSYGLN